MGTFNLFTFPFVNEFCFAKSIPKASCSSSCSGSVYILILVTLFVHVTLWHEYFCLMFYHFRQSLCLNFVFKTLKNHLKYIETFLPLILLCKINISWDILESPPHCPLLSHFDKFPCGNFDPFISPLFLAGRSLVSIWNKPPPTQRVFV